jgi:hypothetical protein
VVVGDDTVVEEVDVREGGVSASYTGETGFGLLVRGSQHLQAMAAPASHPDNAFVKHTAEYHQGEEQEVEYKMEVVGHYNKPLVRQITEGCEIHGDQSNIIMNSKLDHHLPAVSRVVFSQTARRGGRGSWRGRGRRIRRGN